MANNDSLLTGDWAKLDPVELKLVLEHTIGGPGQYENILGQPNSFYLPSAGLSCEVEITFRGNNVNTVKPGKAFDAGKWRRITSELEQWVLMGPDKSGREYSFSSFRVNGWWRGDRSGIQILPPPDNAPRAPVEMAEHPFILEFPVQASNFDWLTKHRHIREHRTLTRLLNILLAGRTSLQPVRQGFCWAQVHREEGRFETQWVQQGFSARLGTPPVVDQLSSPAGEPLEAVHPDEYYRIVGHDGKPLRVPADLDNSLRSYKELSAENRANFDRATFWIDMASRQWNMSMSASFASLVSAIEALTGRGEIHRFKCPVCSEPTQHEEPGATRRFRDFFDTYAPGAALAKARNEMYDLRSAILHGSDLMELDQERAFVFAWYPPRNKEQELHDTLWRLTRIALRNWIIKPP